MILALILLLSDDALARQTQEIASGLRCPVCQGLSVADSPSEMAVNMKAEVRSLLERGYTREQIEQHFVRSYGEFVLLAPKFRGVNALVWVLPVAAFFLGGFFLMLKLRRLTSPQQPPKKKEDPAVARVRELVKGASS